ncbi:MAG TPA: hypothetical protein PLU52_10195 [Opitutaceae bacterium]|nr:hypothetical protein [Opitutaceae bacterium]
MTEKPLVYIILGAAGSGRRAIVADLIEAGLDGATTAVLLAETEAADPADSRLPGLARWKAEDEFFLATLPKGATHVFFITDGRRNPVEQLEALKTWVEAQAAEVGRVLCVVNCQLGEKHAPLLAWFEACVHFSDVVLLTRREGVANKWLSDFRGHFEKQYYPCLFEFVKDGQVKNPALVLDPAARRLSHAFDAEQDWVFTDADGEEIDEDEETDGDEEVEATPEVDPYFARDAALRRVKKIPDITKFLPPVG